VLTGGLGYKDFAKVEYLPFGESVELIKNRQLDATLQSAGLGVASIRLADYQLCSEGRCRSLAELAPAGEEGSSLALYPRPAP
jgi:hypothetical protein